MTSIESPVSYYLCCIYSPMSFSPRCLRRLCTSIPCLLFYRGRMRLRIAFFELWRQQARQWATVLHLDGLTSAPPPTSFRCGSAHRASRLCQFSSPPSIQLPYAHSRRCAQQQQTHAEQSRRYYSCCNVHDVRAGRDYDPNIPRERLSRNMCGSFVYVCLRFFLHGTFQNGEDVQSTIRGQSPTPPPPSITCRHELSSPARIS